MRTKTVNGFPFDRVVFISLKRRLDRRKHIDALIDKFGFGETVEIMDAVDRLDLDRIFLKRHGYKTYKSWTLEKTDPIFDRLARRNSLSSRQLEIFRRYWSMQLNNGDYACGLSHYRAWKRIIEQKWDTTLILEDDADLLPNSIEILSQLLPKMSKTDRIWDFLYVGRTPMNQSEKLVSKYFYRARFNYTTHAYIIRLSGAKKLVRPNYQKNLIPIDEFIPSMYCAHPRKDVRELFGTYPRLRAYAIKVELAFQGRFGSEIVRPK